MTTPTRFKPSQSTKCTAPCAATSLSALLFAGALLLLPTVAPAQHEGHKMAGYHAEMQAQMQKMNMDMMSAPMTGNPDLDFAIMMIPHHQGAIDMAKTQLKYGKDAKLRTLAEVIIASQQKEIEEMKARIVDLGGTVPLTMDSAGVTTATRSAADSSTAAMSAHSSH